MLQRLAEAGGLELRIFRRDGQRFGRSQQPTLAEAPDSNADLMAEFLNEKRGQTWQSIPVAVFYTGDLRYLYHYVEYPRIYDKDRLVYGHIRVPRPGETREATGREWSGSSGRSRRRRSSASGPRPRSTRSCRRFTSGSSSARAPDPRARSVRVRRGRRRLDTRGAWEGRAR